MPGFMEGAAARKSRQAKAASVSPNDCVQRWVASIPFWAVVLIYVPLRIRALKGFAHVITPLSLSNRNLHLPSVLLFYLRLLVWPSGLSCYYDTPYISSPGWNDFLPALRSAGSRRRGAGILVWAHAPLSSRGGKGDSFCVRLDDADDPPCAQFPLPSGGRNCP